MNPDYTELIFHPFVDVPSVSQQSLTESELMHRNRRLLYVRHLSVTAQPVLLLTLTNSRMLLIMA